MQVATLRLYEREHYIHIGTLMAVLTVVQKATKVSNLLEKLPAAEMVRAI
jgi:hypothetical protein